MGQLIQLPLALALLAFLALPSCRLAAPTAQARDLRQATQKAVRAHLSPDGHLLSLRFLLPGRDAFATGPLDGAPTAALRFQPDPRAAPSSQAAPRKKARPLPVFGPDVWRRTADALALRLAPPNPAHGTLILAGGRQLIAHRLAQQGHLTTLEQRPSGLTITRTLQARELAQEVFTLRGDALDHPGGQTGPALFLTGTFPELAYLDHQARRLVFLSVPPERQDLLLASWTNGNHAVRQISSFLWRSNVLALLRNPFSTAARLAASATSISRAGLDHLFDHFPTSPPPPLAQAPPMDLHAWQHDLAKLTSSPPSAASLQLQLGGDAFFPAFTQALQEAQHSLDLQLYIFDTDDYAITLADLMKKRSREGLRIRVLFDESASLSAAAAPPAHSPSRSDFTPPDDIAAYLRLQSQIQVRTMPMSGLTASHTKIIAIDHQVAWLGGMNIGREYRYDWHDLMLQVRGPLVQVIEHDFARAWARHSWGGDLAEAFHRARPSPTPPPAPPGAFPVQPLYTSAWHHEIASAQLTALARCRQRAWLENAYLSDHAFLAALIAARHRGVDVRIVFPATNDNAVMAANNRALIPLLRRHGIRVFLRPGMSHIKAALYDGWACVGSANFDRLSLRVNHEFSIGFSDPTTTADLQRRLFEDGFRSSREINGTPAPSPSDALLTPLIRSLAGQL